MLGVNALSSEPIEIILSSVLYRCYRAMKHGEDGATECFVVAGIGSVTIAKDSGAVVSVAPVIRGSARLLERLAPHIHARSKPLEHVALRDIRGKNVE